MTRPHAALLEIAAGGDPGAVGDEPELLASAAEHRMVGAVLAAQKTGRVRLAAESSMTLGVWELGERYRHERLWRTIATVHRRLGALGDELVVVKGVATEARWYEETGQRICTDVDVLLPPHAFGIVADVVEALDPDRGQLGAIDHLLRRRLLQHVDLRVDGVAVDLHFDPFKIGLWTRQVDEVWGTVVPLATAHGTITVLRPEIELVLLLLHLNKDRFSYLGAFLDVRRLLEGADVDWDYVADFVAGEGLQVPVWKSLAAVDDVLGTRHPIPPIPALAGWTWDRLWGADKRLGGHEGRRAAPSVQPLLALHATGRTADKAREARRQVLPPRPLLEVAGRLEPDGSYLRYMTIDRLRRTAPETADMDVTA